MEHRARHRPLAAAVIALAALALAAATAAGALSSGPTLHVSQSGGANAREDAKKVPIGRRPGARKRVVLSIPPRQLGPVRAGDRVEGLGEVELSVTCLEASRQCVGRPYDFTPHLELRPYLSDTRKGGGGYPIGRWKKATCSQKLPNRNHHCTYTFDRAATIGQESPPCAPRCFMKLVVSAWHTGARKGNVLVVGADSADGSISQGKGRLGATVFSPGDPSQFPPLQSPRVTHRRHVTRIPVVEHEHSSTDKRVIYSVKLPRLHQGEQLIVVAHARAAIGHLGYNVFFQSQLVLSRYPDRVARSVIPSHVAGPDPTITPLNGFNCTQGRSQFDDPCAIDKAGVLRIVANSRTKPWANKGRWVPLYVDFIAGAAAEFEGQSGHWRAGDAARLRSGYIKVYRFDPQYKG